MIRKRTPFEREVDRELISKGRDALKDFDENQALYVPGKKRESKPISIRLPMDMIRQLRAVAMQKGNIGYQQLIRMLLDEALMEAFRSDALRRQERQGVLEEVSSTSSSLEVELEALGREFKVPMHKEAGVFNQSRR
ncbi:MAG: hypothetical protein HY211_02825 [Candidatus Omnitrophica bacterium]|nr:hypothetical protein [Candidatus Omnitrophota bacterium]